MTRHFFSVMHPDDLARVTADMCSCSEARAPTFARAGVALGLLALLFTLPSFITNGVLYIAFTRLQPDRADGHGLGLSLA